MADVFADDGVRSHVTSQTRKRLGKVPMIMSTCSVKPKYSAVPFPYRPSTPNPCASSTMTRAPYFCKRYDFGQLAYVAAHAENSVGDYELAVGIRRGGQLCFKVRHVAVGVSYKLGVAESAAVINAGMVSRSQKTMSLRPAMPE